MAFERFIQSDGQLIGIVDGEPIMLYDYNLDGNNSRLRIELSESYSPKTGAKNYRVIFKETGKREADTTLEHYPNKETAEQRTTEIRELFEKLIAFK